jgi:hypothetical protein
MAVSSQVFPFVGLRVGHILNGYKYQEQLIYNSNVRRFQIAQFARQASNAAGSLDVTRSHSILNAMDRVAGTPDVML